MRTRALNGVTPRAGDDEIDVIRGCAHFADPDPFPGNDFGVRTDPGPVQSTVGLAGLGVLPEVRADGAQAADREDGAHGDDDQAVVVAGFEAGADPEQRRADQDQDGHEDAQKASDDGEGRQFRSFLAFAVRLHGREVTDRFRSVVR
ncbi:hypothetical protein [Amycolatopsis sp. WAC 04182]|uniref:hypothetical protein n=1 Tax=Amycolatopsis sp. WAC 04182 TaxID=2203198 RepID=UPI0018F36A08|nr:hypothetical protein [Amycolatopsis sp. WAC 04182]